MVDERNSAVLLTLAPMENAVTAVTILTHSNHRKHYYYYYYYGSTALCRALDEFSVS
jgi:hypothetical protein